MDFHNVINTNYHIVYRSEKILKPKRVYKRPVLQRLANRWYGMIDTGYSKVCLRYYPTKLEQIREPILEYYSFADLSSKPESVAYKTRVYELPIVGYDLECRTSEWEYYQRELLKRIEHEVLFYIKKNTKIYEI